MNMMKKIRYHRIGILLILFSLSFLSCEKFLNVKEDQKIVIPETLNDLQALLDAAVYINYGYYPALLEIATDDFYLTPDAYSNATEFEKDNYLWRDYPLYLNQEINVSWMFPFRNLLIANTVLDELPNIESDDLVRKNEIRGTALFFRSYVFFQLAQVFCDAYELHGENIGPGLPLRLNPDFNEVSRRATVGETYGQIITDLEEAVSLLPAATLVPTRPSRGTAYAAMAKVCLAMGDYERALINANNALDQHNELLDYNDLNPLANIPIERFNNETIFYAYSSGFSVLRRTSALVDSSLYKSYEDNDLRKIVCFIDNGNGSYGFKGGYTGSSNNAFFVGLTTSELLLIQAECYARADHIDLALEALNRLLEYRYERETFVPHSAIDQEDCIKLILAERRKELLFRGVRWSDLKRLNKEGRFVKTLERKMVVNGVLETFTLLPNDPRYNFTIPAEVIVKTGMQQNIR